MNRKTSHIQHKPSGNLVTTYDVYDEEGNLDQMTDPKGQTFTYDYDALNRQTDAYVPATSGPFNTSHIHTDYDANNNITQVTETKTGPSGSITDVTVNNYDDFDRLDDTTQRGRTIDYGYDNNGNRTSVQTSPCALSPAPCATSKYRGRC